MSNHELPGYPSIDRPWLKYYRQEVIVSSLPDGSIYDELLASCKDTPDAPALNYYGKETTYGELLKNIMLAAKAFSALGVKAGDIVTLFSLNTPETIYCIYALNYLGAVPNLEYVTLSEKEAADNLMQTGSRYVLILDVLLKKFGALCNTCSVDKIIVLPVHGLTSKAVEIRQKLRRAGQKLVLYRDFLKSGRNTEAAKHTHIKNELAVIVHSGGTTGVPKGVMLSNEALNSIAWQYANFDAEYKRGDTFMHSIPPFHAFGLGTGINMPLQLGFELILIPSFDEKTIVDFYVKYRPTHLLVGPSHIHGIITSRKAARLNLSHIKTFALGGAALTSALAAASDSFLDMHGAKCKTCVGYGMSELASTVCTGTNSLHIKPGSVGIPFCKANVKVLGEDSGSELGYCQPGELCFSSPGLMLGYYNNDSATNSAIFTDDHGTRWLHTGDIGYVDTDGFVFVTGRAKRIYAARSEKGGMFFKLYPDYITSVISEIEHVNDCAVVCISDPDCKYIPAAFIVGDGTPHVQIREHILRCCAVRMASHNIPKKLIFVDKLPVTPAGKVDYRALERMAADERQ